MGAGAGALLVTGRAELVEEVSAMASAAGVAVVVAADAASVGRTWPAAGLVLVGDDAAGAGAPSRRPGVVLLAAGEPDEPVWRAAVDLGADQVLVLPRDRQALLGRLALLAEDDGARAARRVAVVAARGGAGASTLATALAVRAAGTGPALLVDADPWGGGLDLLVGLERVSGFRWPDLAGARGTVRAALLRDGLPRLGPLGVLSFDREVPATALPAAAVTAVLDAAARGHDTVVADLARRDDAATRAVLAATDVLLLVVPAQVRAVAGAARVLDAVGPHVADVRLVVVTSGPGLAPDTVVDALQAPLAATTTAEAGLAAAAERGELPGSRRRGALARCCEELDPVLAPVSAGAAAPW